MVDATDKTAAEETSPRAMRTVVAASSAGTAFEWYDFFVFGALASLLAKNFFSGVNETAGFIFALGAFGAGFAFRPLGALVFGRYGDIIGRKKAFLVTVTLMGVATIAIGLLPTYKQAGLLGPALLIFLRIVQGFALGGEYGGAAIYVAEHSTAKARGRNTGWIQISAAFGLLGALAVILSTRLIIGEDAFAAWGWRVPFLLSAGLLGVSLWMRMNLNESPAFVKMQAEEGVSKAPFTEAFARWANLKLVLIAFFGIMLAQGVVWYTAFFYSQFFLERIIKLEPATVNLLMIAVTVISAPLYVVFGWVSDKVGRKPVMLFGMILCTVSLFPAFHLVTAMGNPALAQATDRTPVVVIADPADCSLQFDPVGKRTFSSSCDLAKTVLANAGISYRNQAAAAGSVAVVKIGDTAVVSKEGGGLAPAAFKAVKSDVESRLKTALSAAGYPLKADPASVNFWGVLGAMMIFIVAAVALYAPIAATLVELFPTRVRYTAMSLPYHIGTGWMGGFLPFVAFAMVAASGNTYFGLWYPVIATTISIVVCLFLVPETRGRDITK